MTDLTGLETYRTVRDEYVDTANPPTSTLVQVAALTAPEFRLEVEAVAIVAYPAAARTAACAAATRATGTRYGLHDT